MAMKMLLGWGAQDSTLLLNSRFKEVFKKGFTSGATVTLSGSTLEATVSPFVLVNFDGAVAVSDAPVTLPIGDGIKTYIVMRARYRSNNNSIMALQALSAAAFGADPEADWLNVVATIDLTTGGPHSFPPASSLSYTERDEVDQVGRSFWRDPVATLGALPLDRNIHGDTRLVTDTGSLHWWNETAGIWEIFDEVPLTHHRQTEHSNGLIARSVATALQPGVTGTNVTVQAVPAGSGYTVDGRFVAAPASNQSIAASTAGTNRGLIQLGYDLNGLSTLNYRVGRDADALDLGGVRILDISDDHPLGTFSLVYDPARGFIWGGGEPGNSPGINMPFKLKNSAGTHWITIAFSGAYPVVAVSDNYIVNASLKDNTHFLVGYWYWDGSSVLVLGADKRVRGTLGYDEMSSDFKRDVINAIVIGDNRQDGVIRGGEVINDLGTLSARVAGPIVCVIGGTRFVADGNYTGVAFPASTVRCLYVDQNGVLAQAAGFPSDGSPYAGLAIVTTNATTITEIQDYRYGTLVAANHEGNVNVVMGKDSSFGSRNHYTENKRVFETRGPVGDVEGTVLSSGILEAIESELRTGGPLNITDGSYDNFVSNNDYPTINDVLPGAAVPSIVEAITAAGEVSALGVGVASASDFAISTSGLNITLSTGVAYTSAGMKLRTLTNTVLAVGAIATNTTAYVYLNSLTKAFVVSTTKPQWKRDVLMAVFSHNGGTVNNLLDCRPLCDGTRMNTLTIGADTGNFRGATSLRAAVATICAFDKNTVNVPSAPSIIDFVDDSSLFLQQNTVDLGDFYGSSLKTLTIRDQNGASLFWGVGGAVTNAPLFNLRGLLDKFIVRGVAFTYAGDGNVSDNFCFAKDPKQYEYDGFSIRVLDPTTGVGVRHLHWYSMAGGSNRSPSKITNSDLRGVSGMHSAFYYTAAVNETVSLDTTTIACSSPAFENPAVSLFASTVAVNVKVSAVNCVLEAGNTFFNFNSGSRTHVVITGGEILAYGNNSVMGIASSNNVVDVFGAVVTCQGSVPDSTLTLTGVVRFEGVDTILSTTSNTTVVVGSTSTRFQGCDLDISGRFRTIDNSNLRLQAEMQPAVSSTAITHIASSTLSRVGGGRILNVASGQTCLVASSTLTYTGTVADDPGTSAVLVGGLLRANGARLIMNSRTSTALELGTNGNVVWNGGAISASGGKVTDGTPLNAPALDLETSGMSFNDVEFFVSHIPDVSGTEVYAFGAGVIGTVSTPQTSWFSFYRMVNCRVRFDTPYWLGIFQTSKVEMRGNRFTAAASNNVLTGTNPARITIGSNVSSGVANVSVASAFQQNLTWDNNIISFTRESNVGLARMEVNFHRFHTLKMNRSDFLSLTQGTASTQGQTLTVNVTPHYQQSVSPFASEVEMNENKVRVISHCENNSQVMTAQVEVLDGTGSGSATAGIFSANHNTVISHCVAVGTFTGSTVARLRMENATATIGCIDNNTVRAHPSPIGCDITAPATANTFAGTANLLNDGSGSGSITGTFVQTNTSV